MKHKREVLFILVFFCFSMMVTHAQEIIPAAGGNVSGSTGSVSYTVGQILCGSLSGTHGTITQGVQQPYEISVVTGINETSAILFKIEVYPNPTKDLIILKAENFEIENISYLLYSSNGTLLRNNRVEGTETRIAMSNLEPATYFLKVIWKNKGFKTFKIIKN